MNPLKDAHVVYLYDEEENYAGFEALFCGQEDIQRARNYLESQQELEAFNSHYDGTSRVGVLKLIWVEEEYRGEGIGSSLLEEFLFQSKEYNMDAVCLVADTGECNAFNLVSWYESNGFVKVTEDDDFPFMWKSLH